MNTAVILPALRICLVIPSNTAHLLAGWAIRDGQIRRSSIGLPGENAPLHPRVVRCQDLPANGGVQVAEVGGSRQASRQRPRERARECQRQVQPSRSLQTIVAIAAAICCAAPLQAQDTGQVPYATIHKAVSRAQQVKHPKLRAFVIVESKTKPDKPVTMVIRAKSGPINVDISKEGEIRNFPLSAELLKENPPVLSNQPKGSSALVVGLELVVPDTLTYSYRELAQQLEDANAEVRKQAGMLSLVAPRAKAVVFQFRAGGKATVTVNRKEPQVLTADADGRVRLEIDKSVAAQDPQVAVSEKPVRVLVN